MCVLLSGFLVAACGSDAAEQGNTTTHAVVPNTIEGICSKLDALACAQPNCVQKMKLAEATCRSFPEDLQELLDCMALATFTCAGNPRMPRTEECGLRIASAAHCFE
jgi:hypothetical protein